MTTFRYPKRFRHVCLQLVIATFAIVGATQRADTALTVDVLVVGGGGGGGGRFDTASTDSAGGGGGGGAD